MQGKPARVSLRGSASAGTSTRRAKASETGAGRSRAAGRDVGGAGFEAGALTEGGEPLPEGTRAFFEPLFGERLPDVRIHRGAVAERRALDVDASAFTYRKHIWLGRGQTPRPSRLLAHELAHVLQHQRAERAGPFPLRRQERAQTRVELDVDPALGCTSEQLQTIGAAGREAIASLGLVLQGLDALLGARRGSGSEALSPEQQRASTALSARFGSDEARVAAHVRARLAQALDLLRNSRTLQTRCGEASGCESRAATFSRRTNSMRFCTAFFAPPRDVGAVSDRALTIIHEITHGLTGRFDINDIAYADELAFQVLPPHLALVNADSYAFFVADYVNGGSGHSPTPVTPFDAGCDGAFASAIRIATATAQGWNSRAAQVSTQRDAGILQNPRWTELRQRHLGGADVETLQAASEVYAGHDFSFRLGAFGIQCHAGARGPCGSLPALVSVDRNAAIASMPGAPLVHLCAGWLGLNTEQQTLWLLAALYAYSDGRGAPTLRDVARAHFAREAYRITALGGTPPSLEALLEAPVPAPQGSGPQ